MVWKYFKQDGDIVICKICDAKLRYHHSTSSMRSHLGTHPLPAANSAPAGRSGGASRKHRQTTFAEYAKRPMTNSRKK